MRILDFLRSCLARKQAASIEPVEYIEPSSCISHACSDSGGSHTTSYVNAEIDNPEKGTRFGYYFLAEGYNSRSRSQTPPDAIVMKSISESLLDAPIERLARKYTQLSDEECESAIRTAFQEAHKALRDIAADTAYVTLTGAFIRGRSMSFGHVGANRLYWIDRNTFQALTRDHTLKPMMPPYQTALYRVLGQGHLTIDVSTHKNLDDGYLLLCTWRLWESVSEDYLRDTVMTSASLENACTRLLKKAWNPLEDRELALIVASYPKPTQKISPNNQTLPR